jgi:hypothetical protein
MLFYRMVNNSMTLLKFFLATIGVNCVKYVTHSVRNIVGVSEVTNMVTNRICEVVCKLLTAFRICLFNFCAELAEVNCNSSANTG